MKGSITAYRMGTQFSMVTHWKTVNMASPMLSKEVMPGEQNRDITINQPAGGFSVTFTFWQYANVPIVPLYLK